MSDEEMETQLQKWLTAATEHLEEASAALQLVGKMPEWARELPPATSARIMALMPEIDAIVDEIVAARKRVDQVHSRLAAETN
jgi:hypothetical protein